MSRPTKLVITKTGIFLGEVDTSGSSVKIYSPMQVNYQQTSPGVLSVGVTPYPPGVKDLVDDLEDFGIAFDVSDVLCITRPSDGLKNEYIKGSNVFRNIAVPTTGQIIDVGTNK